MILTASCLVFYTQVVSMTFNLKQVYAYTVEKIDSSAYWDIGDVQVNWFYGSSTSQIRIFLIRVGGLEHQHEGKIIIMLFKGTTELWRTPSQIFGDAKVSFWYEYVFNRPSEGLDYKFKIIVSDT